MENRHKGNAQVTDTDDFAEAEQPNGPERRCVVTGRVLPKAQLLRFAVGPDGQVVVDLNQRLPGRGIWLLPERDVVHTAIGKKAFARAAKRQVQVAPDLADQIEHLLLERCLNTLGMARRAGQAVAGYEKVRAEITAKRAGLVLEASDGSPDGVGRMRALATGLPVVDVLTGAELGNIFGRDVTVHATLAKGALARNLVDQAGRLAGFRKGQLGSEG